jgi:hypothetical protein
MVVEHFKDVAAIYRRFGERGRMLPEGLSFVSSWIDEDLTRCFQLMETDDPTLFTEWTAHWNDLADFEIFPVIDSKEAAARVAGSAGGPPASSD